MLTLSCHQYCLPAAGFQLSGGTFGADGQLAVALVQQGRCRLAPHPGAPCAEAGDLVLAGAQATLLPLGPCAVSGLFFRGAAAHELAGALPAPAVVRPVQAPGAAALFRRLLAGWAQLSQTELSAAAYHLLCRLAAAEADAAPRSQLVAAALEAIHAHFAEVYGVQELADGLEVNKSHLIRCFSAELGISPGQYLTQVRVDHARDLLLEGEFSLEIIATLCGFSGANYLCKVFKRVTGETPRQWRQRAVPGARGPLRRGGQSDLAYL